MKHKVSELEGALLDAAVAKAEGLMPSHGWASPGQQCDRPPLPGQSAAYSTDWADGGPIIERERIVVEPLYTKVESSGVEWLCGVMADYGWEGPECTAKMNGPTPLIAAMRAYVASKFGEDVEI